MRNLHQTPSAKLISALIAIVLTLASAIGACAHAFNQHDHAVHARHTDSLFTSSGADHRHQGSLPDDNSNHAKCADAVCHAGYAIIHAKYALPIIETTQPEANAPDHAVGIKPPSLDRPPRSSTQA